jgi:2-polyprenyl-3-methyl-5-hydroxy-6-metoxy-1,4-benzoquinol methylase
VALPILGKLTSYEDTESFVNRMRNARFRFFDERVKALNHGPLTLLDVGGYEQFWVARGYQGRDGVQITVLNLEKEATHYPNVTSVKGNACDLSEFADRQFDIVFSNSVIEHLHNYEAQQAMAREVQRVGKYHFVQTPNRFFLIEPHYLLPGFQFLPRAVQTAVLTKTSWSRQSRMNLEDAEAILDEIRLLTETEVRKLFPRSRIYKEKFLGMTKSFTAHNL